MKVKKGFRTKGLGQFALAPFATFLLNNFDWKITIFIMAGVSISGVLFGFLMRPVLHSEENLEARQNNRLERRLVNYKNVN